MKQSRKHYYRQITMRNASDVDILFVEVGVPGSRNSFGFLGAGGAGATASECYIRFVHDFSVQWEEENTVRTKEIDIMLYKPQMAMIESFTFVYRGNDKWDVLAQEGKRADSRIVTP
jgi:hypothetical protein